MNQNIKSFLAVFILIIIFLVSLNHNYNKEYINFCQENRSCILSLIEETKNYTLCDYANNKGECYEIISVKNNLEKYCEFSNNISNCYSLLAIKNLDINLCKKSTNIDKCVFQIALIKNESSICENGEDKEYCYYSYAYKVKDINLCEKSGKYKQICIKKLS